MRPGDWSTVNTAVSRGDHCSVRYQVRDHGDDGGDGGDGGGDGGDGGDDGGDGLTSNNLVGLCSPASQKYFQIEYYRILHNFGEKKI